MGNNVLERNGKLPDSSIFNNNVAMKRINDNALFTEVIGIGVLANLNGYAVLPVEVLQKIIDGYSFPELKAMDIPGKIDRVEKAGISMYGNTITHEVDSEGNQIIKGISVPSSGIKTITGILGRLFEHCKSKK